IARSPSSPTDAPRVKFPKRYLLSSSGKPPLLRGPVEEAPSSSAWTARGAPRNRGTKQNTATNTRGQSRRHSIVDRPPALGRLPHTNHMQKRLVVTVKSK